MKNKLRYTLTLTFLITFLINAQPAIDSKIIASFQKGETQLGVIITFNTNAALSYGEITVLKKLGIVNAFSFKSLPMVGAIITPSLLEKLKERAEIKSVYFNKQLEYYNYDATAITGVDRLRSDAAITAKNGGLPVSGKGVTVLINDSGIDGTHDDIKFGTHLIQNAMGSTNPHAYSDLLPIVYLENIPNTDNNSGHGTHCAGTVGGTGIKSAGKYEGVALGANLIGYGSGAALFVLDGLGGFDYALTNQFLYGIRIITNSWGSSGQFDPYDPINIATKLAYDRGIVILFAAGNAGPGEDTHNPYAIAPWVISVAAGDKFGGLADFSSRGVKDQTGSFELNGETWTYENRPTLTAPGVGIVSTRAIAPVSSLGAETDANTIESAYLPFYTTMDGTSMATPHTAGVVALMLEVNKSLSPSQVKTILQITCTNMPGYETWEAGAGYINAYAAVDYVINNRNYSSLVNSYQTFNGNVKEKTFRHDFSIDYNTDPSLSSTNNMYSFGVVKGTSAVEVMINTYGVLGQTGNPLNLVLISPDGTEYSSGVPVAFAITYERTVAVTSPVTGTWKIELRGLRGDAANPTDGAAVPETIEGKIKFVTFLGFTGLNDISGNSAEAAIKLAVSSRLVDSFPGGYYKPNNSLTRIDFAKYLMMGQAIRQYYPTNGAMHFHDVSSSQNLFVESVTNSGSPLRDKFQIYKGVMLPTGAGTFSPNNYVKRLDIAYSLVQTLGLQPKADSLNGTSVKVIYNDQQIVLEDDKDIPSDMKGYVQLAIDLNLINVYYSLTQGPYDLYPTIKAYFKPKQVVKRSEFAVIITRTFSEWSKSDALGKKSDNIITQSGLPINYFLDQNYPNPFNPTTNINYAIAKDGAVQLEIYDVLGQRVATLVNDFQKAGKYSATFDASKLASGIYIYRIITADYTKTLKMNLLK